MILSRIFENKDAKSSSPNKGKTLNPYAAEFVPSSFKSLSGDARKAEPSSLDAPLSFGKAILDRSQANASNNSDNEAHQYWCRQLPDDIIPDFGVAGEDELQIVDGLSLFGLSMHDGAETSPFGTSGADHTTNRQDTLTVHDVNDFSLSGSMRSSHLGYNGDQALTPFTNLAYSQWNKRLEHGNQINGKEGHYTGYSYDGFPSDLVNDYGGTNIEPLNPLEFLAAEFPGFTAEYLADVYYRSCCDLNLTMQILSQPKLQVNGGFSENLKTLSAPFLAAIDYPSLSLLDVQNGLLRYKREDQQASSAYQPVSRGSFAFPKHGPVGTPTDGLDLASAVTKCKPENACSWKYERNSSYDTHVGSTASLRLLAKSYNGRGNGKSLLMEKIQSPGTARASFDYLETGDADMSGNMYSETTEVARYLALLQSARVGARSKATRRGLVVRASEDLYVTHPGKEARQSSLLGNKTSAKELSARRQSTSENFNYRPRNSVDHEVLSCGHASEALHMLTHEMTILKDPR